MDTKLARPNAGHDGRGDWPSAERRGLTRMSVDEPDEGAGERPPDGSAAALTVGAERAIPHEMGKLRGQERTEALTDPIVATADSELKRILDLLATNDIEAPSAEGGDDELDREVIAVRLHHHDASTVKAGIQLRRDVDLLLARRPCGAASAARLVN